MKSLLAVETSAGGAQPKAVLAFNHIARNNDDHAKNFSFGYNVNNTLIYEIDVMFVVTITK